jgi:hypothetical protein
MTHNFRRVCEGRSLDADASSSQGNSVSAQDMIVPDEQQIRILRDVRARIALRWQTTEIKHEQHFQHWEDPELDIPPIGESAGFSVKLPVLDLYVGTPLPWESSPKGRLRISFFSYNAGHNGEPWALVIDSATRDRLAEAGIERGNEGRAWSLDNGTEQAIADSIVETITRLADVPIRVLRRADLPGDVEWPWHALVNVMTADEIVSIDPQSNGETLITSVTAGRRTATQVRESDLRLLEWWWASNGQSPGAEKEKR